ncbi:MAG: histidinol-phosphate transaminase [Lachnospiraceae bacterium]|nr:histidinol-phosphate transaminase [Lachnospiraceae bacterium]
MTVEDNIRKVTPYSPGEQPQGKVIKLNTNESPYPPSPKVTETLRSLDWDRLRLYPDPKMTDLIESLAAHYGVKTSEVFAGVGSDDVLSMCFLTFFAGDRPIFFPDITYSFYDVWADVYRIPYETKALNDDFRIKPEDYYAENGGVVIANPNAPTGIGADLLMIEDIIQHNPDSVVIVDEAYIDFGAESALPLINKYDNLIVVRTMSKSRAMAGMRLGYCFGNEKLIRYLNDVKYSVNSYTLNYPSIAAGKAAIEDKDYFDDIVSRIRATRENTKKRLMKLTFSCFPSDTNFLFVKPPEGIAASEVFAALKEKGIYVRYFNKERISDYLRITIGSDDEMDALIDALKEIVDAVGHTV